MQLDAIQQTPEIELDLRNMKTGKEFEELISYLHSCMADKARVESNIYLIDKDTGRKRQIDILISIKDGLYTLRIIVEVRDHTRPIGVEYVGAVHNKKESVGANMAAIVSKSGFSESALKKTQSLGMRAFTYKEAITSSWADWMLSKSITFKNNRYELLHLSPKVTQEIYYLRKEKLDKLPKIINPKDTIFSLGEQKNPASFDSILRGSSLFNTLWNGLIPNGKPVKKQIRLFPQIPLYLVSDNCDIPLVRIEAILELNVIETNNPLEYDALIGEAGISVTDILSTSTTIDQQKYRLRMVTEGGKPYLGKGQKLNFRMDIINDQEPK
jgi:hypothetical protein